MRRVLFDLLGLMLLLPLYHVVLIVVDILELGMSEMMLLVIRVVGHNGDLRRLLLRLNYMATRRQLMLVVNRRDSDILLLLVLQLSRQLLLTGQSLNRGGRRGVDRLQLSFDILYMLLLADLPAELLLMHARHLLRRR